MTITEFFLVAVVGGVASIVVSLLTQGLQFFKWKTGEKRKLDSEYANEISQAAAELIKPLKAELKEVREKNDQLNKTLSTIEDRWKTKLNDVESEWNKRFSSLQVEYIELQKELALFKNWVERLSYQVRSLGGDPVPFLIKPVEFKYNDSQTQPLNPDNPNDVQE